MNILICGGIKTQNIIKSLDKKFSTGGINLICAEDIDDIEDLLNVGNYFDRAIIIEQSWTKDGNDRDEFNMRHRLNNFCNVATENHKKGMSYVYLTQTEESAKLVYDETATLYGDSVILIQKPPYSVTFFSDMIRNDIKGFNKDIVYSPVVDDEHYEDEESNIIEDSYELEEESDLSRDLFEDFSEDLFDNESFEDIQIEDAKDAFEIEVDSVEIEEQEETDKRIEEDNFEEEERFEEESFEEESFEEEDIQIEIEEDEEDIQIEIEEEIKIDKEPEPIKMEPIKKEKINATKKKEKTRSLFRRDRSKKEVKKSVDKVEQNDTKSNVKIDDSMIETFKVFASRGNSIVVSGFGGSGSSTIAFNLANTICNLGFSVLLVDMDTFSRSQSHISKTNYDSMEPDGVNLLEALKSASNITGYVSVTKPGFRLLSMGIAGDIIPLDNIIEPSKLARFINLAKNNHNFIIYDIPFNSATGVAKDILYSADNIVLSVDCSNWGITKAMLGVYNIEEDDMADLIFSRAQIVLNRVTSLNTLMNKKVSNINDILGIVDDKVVSLLGVDTGYYFKDIGITGLIKEIDELRDNWFTDSVYSDTPEGKELFALLLKEIVLKKDSRI